ncbi:hypothetical protein [uncultured Apibacter sp.]|uniref:hypothetical protein n=1 Tax=uncultured Apibacter sp. TaxID=1778616 RepID=UPI0025E740BF|nr:hypothetical protein [uncultured Apibacter sp.]
MKKTIIFLITLIGFISCTKSQKIYTKIENKKNMSDNIENILKEQVLAGYSENEPGLDGGSTYLYSDKDMKACVELSENILKTQEYKFPSQAEFENKIKEIFRFNSKQNIVNFLIEYPCSRDSIVYQLDINYVTSNNSPLFILFDKKFILEPLFIPELIDYKKKYPKIFEEENSISDKRISKYGFEVYVTKWKDVKDLNENRNNNIQILVNRNKYLFNDSKSSLAWLKVNDEYFLESLVITFGYTKDKDLLDWVMQRNRSKAVEFINNYVFVRNCKGELEIREDILKYIEQKTTDEENTHDYAKALYHYEVYENPNKWTEKEAYKILAYKSNTYDYLFMKYKNIRDNNRWNILGSIYYYSNRGDEKEWKEIEKNFEMNNYYNLPHLKEALEYAYIFE